MEYVKCFIDNYTGQVERGKSMLAQTVRNNLKSIQNLQMITKTTKFSSLFQTQPTVMVEETSLEDALVLDKLFDFIKTEENEVLSEDETFAADIISDMDSETVDEVLLPEGDTEDLESGIDEISEYIVENPDEVVVQFPIISNIALEEKLPFFQSLSFKLANIYG